MTSEQPYTILNVDDDEASRYAKGRILRRAGYRVVEAATGRDALRLLHETRPQLVVLDVGLPDLSGTEVCRLIKTSPATAHIMVLHISASSVTALDRVRGLEGGADTFLTEPIEADELLASVRSLLRLYQREAENRRLMEQMEQEIAERARVEETLRASETKLRSSEQKFRDATEAASCGMWDWNLTTGRLDWFGAHERLAGLAPGSFGGTIDAFYRLLHPDDAPRVQHDLQAALDRRDSGFADEFRFLLPDGRIRWMAGTGQFFYDAEGRPQRMTGVVQDIHARKVSEERLQSRTARLALLTHAAERLLTHDAPATVLEELFGLIAAQFGLDSYWDYDCLETSRALHLASSAGITAELMPLCRSIEEDGTPFGTCLETREPVVLERVQESADPCAVLLQRNGNRAYVGFPLVVEDERLGALGFASRSREAFEADEIAFLGTIAQYVAMVKARRRSETSLLKRNDRLELLASAAAGLLTVQDAAAMIRSFFDMVRQHLGVDGCLLYSRAETGSMLKLEASAGLADEAFPTFHRLGQEPALACVSGPSQPAVIAEGLGDLSEAGLEGVTRLGFRALVCYPLTLGERCLGTLLFASRSKDRFGRDEIECLRTLSHYVAMATERLRLSVEVQRREEMLLRAQRGAHAGLWELDLRTNRLTWSDAYYELLGVPRECQPSEDTWFDHIHPEDRERVRAAYRDALAAQVDQNFEFRVLLPDGGVRWVHRKGQVERDAEGRAVRHSGVSIDITERKRGEEALRASEERWQLAVNGSTDGMWDWEPQSNKAFLSSRWKALRGYADDEIRDDADEWFSRIHPEDVDRVRETLHSYFAGGIPVYECEYRSRCKDGSYKWINDRGQAVWDEAGRVVRMVGSETDITGRKRADERITELNRELGLRAQELQVLVERLRESEAKVKLITDSLPILIAYVDLDQRYRFNNLSYERRFGRPVHEIAGRSMRELVGETVFETLRPHVARVLAGDTQHFEALLPHSSNGLRHVDVTYVPDQDAAGKVRGFFVMEHDMTERRLADERFKDQLNLVETITDNTPSCLLMMDEEGVGTFANPAAETVTGYARQELVGHVLHDVLHHSRPDGTPFPRSECPIEQALACRQSLQAYEDAFLHKDGHVFPVRCAVRPILKDGIPVGTVLEVQDITREKLAEQALREREEQLRIITDSVPSLIAYVDQHERYQFVNAGYERLFGRPRHEIIGRTVKELAGEGYSKIYVHIARVLRGEPVSFESLMVSDGREVTMLASYTPACKGDGSVSGFYILVTDISDRKRAEEALREFNVELEERVEQRTLELVRSQGRLRALATELNLAEQRQRQRLSGDLHDYLAQLLVFVRLKLNQAKREGLGPSSREFLKEADLTLTQALAYTRSLIAELSPPVLRDFGLLVALQWLTEQMQRHELIVSLERQVETISVPEEQAVLLFQSVRELLLNISKHAQTDRALVTVSEEDGMLCIEVKDEGRGFDVEAALSTGSGAADSAHFGLFSIRERMCALGGDFDLVSEPGRGTRATLVLPLGAGEILEAEPASSTPRAADSPLGGAEDSAGRIPAEGGRQDPSGAQSAKVRVLLADDHAMLRQGLRSVLDAYADVEVVGEAADGDEAIRLAQSLQPEVVVMDVNMPGVDGIEATRQLRQEQPTIVVIGLSVHNNPQVEQAMREAGAAGFLTKESAVDQLYLAIQDALGYHTSRGLDP